MPGEWREPTTFSQLAWEKEGAGSWAALRAHQFLTSPLFFPGFLLQALAFLSLLAQLRLLWRSEWRASHGER